jgi:uncharacterized protein YqjF (DUF2071 family)
MRGPVKIEEHAEKFCDRTRSHSEAARERILSLPREPLFLADWQRALMIHFEVDCEALQQVVPFELDQFDGRAFVSAVAFTLSGMRLRFGGRLAAWLLKPIATHHFLNVRTYVRVKGETGIYFLAEWLSNRLSVIFGPRVFGLPYRFGKIEYNHDWKFTLSGRVAESENRNTFAYHAALTNKSEFQRCEPDSLAEWLMERYTAFTAVGAKRRFFRVWHQPWSQLPADVCVSEKKLLDESWKFFCDARLVGANFSPGVADVWMGWPHRLNGS